MPRFDAVSREVRICHMQANTESIKAAAWQGSGDYGRDLDAPVHSMLGLGALFAELAALGVGAEALLQGSGLRAVQLDDPRSRISHRQKILIFGNALRLS